MFRALNPFRKARVETRRSRPLRRDPAPSRLQIEILEDRLTPSATQTFGGLEFMTTGTFATNTSVVTTTSAVQVGVVPAKGATFAPFLQLDGGVTFTSTDTTGKFTTTGTVSGLAGGKALQVLDSQAHTFTAPGLLGTSYYNLASTDTNAPHLTVGGGDLTVTALHLGASELDLQGTLTIPNLPGLSAVVQGTSHVALNSSGVSTAGPDPTVTGPLQFTKEGVTLTVQNLDFHTDQANNAFDISGQGSVTIAGNTLNLTLGNTTTPGLVIANGDLQSLLATVTPPKGNADSPFTFKDLSFALNSATFGFDRAAGTFGIGADATLSLKDQSLEVKLGDANTPGIVIQNGSLASLDGSISTDIKLGGLTFKTEDLAIHYAPADPDIAIGGKASFAFANQTVELALGTTDANGVKHPGLVFDQNTGQIASLDASVITDIKVGNLSFKADDLGIHYAPGADFTITGSASFDLHDDNATPTDQTVSVMLGTADKMHPGLDISPSGQLVSLDAAITTDITVAGLNIKTDGLGVEYHDNDFAIYGGASVAIGGQSVGIKLGDHDNPGLQITNGQLTSLTASLTTDLHFLGIDLTTNDLTFAYTAPANGNPEMIDIYGSVGVTTKFVTFNSTLGTADDPGLEIVGGQLTKLNIVVSGGFSLFGFDVSANNLAINYNGSQLELSGGVTLDLTSAFQISAQLSKGGLVIDTNTGALSLDTAHGLDISGGVQFGNYGITMDVGFQNGPSGVNFHASGTVSLPDNIKVQLTELDVVNGQLADIGISVSAPIPIGDTGFYIDTLSGALENLNNPSQLVVKAGVEISFGPVTEGISVPSIPGIFPGGKFALVDATGNITVSASELILSGQVSILGGLLGQGAATIDLNWTTGVYSVTGNFSMYDGIISFGGGLQITNQGNITLLANASVNVPTVIPFIGGQSLGNLNFYLQYRPELDWTQSYVAAWTNVNLFVTSFTFGFKIDFEGDVSLINGNDVNALATQAAVNSPATNQPHIYSYSYNITDPNAASAEVTISTPSFFEASYATAFGTDNVGGAMAGASGNTTFTSYQLSKQGVILPSLTAEVYDTNGAKPIDLGTITFDQAGNFQFAQKGTPALVPVGASISPFGSITLQWHGNPGQTAINATYTTNETNGSVDSYIEVLQTTSSGAQVPVATYAIDPMGTASTGAMQPASAGGAIYSNQLSGSTPTHPINGDSGTSSQWVTKYTLANGDPDPKTLSFKISIGNTVIGSATLDAYNHVVFTPVGSPAVVPVSGILLDNVISLNWATNPGATSVSAMYRSLTDRVVSINLDKDVATGGLRGQYTVEVISSPGLATAPTFTETTEYKAPTVSFAFGSPYVNSKGQLTGIIYANSFTPTAAQGGPQGSPQDTKISLYYTTSPSTSGGTLIQTLDFGAFLNNAPDNPNVLKTGGFTWSGYQNLPAGKYYIYAAINDGQNTTQYSAVSGSFTTTGPIPVLTVPSFVALTPGTPTTLGGTPGPEQGVFSAANQTALSISTNTTNPVSVELQVSGGGKLLPSDGNPATDATTDFKATYANASLATAGLDGLSFTADGSFTGATSVTFTVSTTVNGKTYQSVKIIPFVTPNTHLVVTQQVSGPVVVPADPDTAVLTISVANPGGPDGQDGANVQVQNYLSKALSLVSAVASQGTYDPATQLWNIGSLPVSAAPVTLTLTLRANAGTYDTPLTNTATGSSTLFNYPATDATSTVAITPQSHAVVITPATLPPAAVGSPYEFKLSADRGGGGPYTFTTMGSLPPGMRLASDGTISGVPTSGGSFTIAATATSASGVSTTRTYTFTVANAALAIAGTPYSLAVGTPNYSSFFMAPGSTLPPGLQLDYSAAGNYVVDGTPTAPGLYTFSVREMSFFFGAYLDHAFTLLVDSPVTPTTTSLPGATAGSPYSFAFAATGGQGAILIDPYSGQTPAGLNWSIPAGVLSGTVSTDATPGIYTFAVSFEDAPGAFTVKTYTLQVNPPLQISPTTLPAATGGNAYSEALAASGGSGSGYTFAVAGGALPAGLTLSPGGTLSGTVPAGARVSTASFVVTVTDSTGATRSQSLSLTVNSAISVAPISLADAGAGLPYNATLTASGGSGSGYTFAVTGGTLPAGLMLSQAGALSGTISASAAAGHYGFTVTATDSQGATGSTQVMLFVDAAITVGPASLPNIKISVPYTQQLTATGGSGVFTFAATGGALPAGLMLSPTGTLSGNVLPMTPAGGYDVTIAVTDSLGMTVSWNCSLEVDALAATWTGAASTAWNNPANWSSGLVPGAGVNVTIPTRPTSGRMPVLNVPATMYNLTLQSGATLTLGGQALSVVGVVTNQGTIILQGNETVRLANGNDTAEGTWKYVGDGKGTTLTVADFGATDYFNLIIADSHTRPDTFTTTADLSVHALTLSGGTFSSIGKVTTAGLSLMAPAVFNTPGQVNDSGNWLVSGGTFHPGAGTVAFTGAGPQQLASGGQAFGNVAHTGSGSLFLASPLLVTGTLTNSGGDLQTGGQSVTVTGATTLSKGNFVEGKGALAFKGGLNVAGGNFMGSSGAVSAGGIQLTGGTLTAPTAMLSDSGDWKVSGGTFVAGNGTVALTGTNQHVSGNTTFHNLTKTPTVADTLTFQAGSKETVTGTLTLKGSTGKLLVLRSSTPGTAWELDPVASAVLAYLDVQDCDYLGHTALVASRSHNSGDNTQVNFPAG